MFMTSNFTIELELPPQTEFNKTTDVEQVLDEVETESKASLLSGLTLSAFLNMQMQGVWGGVNAV